MSQNDMVATSLPAHGRVNCSRCFAGPVVWNETQQETPDGWHVINNPLSWGSQTPRFLLLGVSKGATQCDALNRKPHDQVPFYGFRPKLTEALRLLGLLHADETIEDKIRAGEKDWAFGSMVRCSLGLLDPRNGSISRSGTVVQRLARMDENSSWLAYCTSAFLSCLPERVKVCVLLSNDDEYVAACRSAITRLRPTTRRINAVAYGDEQITWVHIIHVGGLGKNHINHWFAGKGTQGQKRVDAQEAVSGALGRPLPQPMLALTNAHPVHVPKRVPKEDATMPPRATRRATSGEGRPIPNNRTRDAIIARIEARVDIQSHPGQAELHGTKYISEFQTRRGTAFAVDKTSASKQPIWFFDTSRLRSALDLAGIAYDLYPPQRGRNSNLHKLPGFKKGALLRAYPVTAEDALRVVDVLCEALI